MKNMKRAIRRHHKERMISRANRIYNYRGTSQFYVYTREQLAFLANNMTPCSCYMCGNPRRHFGDLTFQELKESEKWNLLSDYYLL